MESVICPVCKGVGGSEGVRCLQKFLATSVQHFAQGEASPQAELERNQPSPTGDDNDGSLTFRQPAVPRMIAGSAQHGWKPRHDEVHDDE